MMPTSRPIACLAALLTLAACGDPASTGAVVTDSAGVRIVENPAPDDRVALVAESEPGLSIGTVDGSAAYAFRNVVDVSRLASGRIVVADGPHVRLYDGEGEHLATAGGQGEGPGEFALLTDVVPCGGEIWAGDLRQQRLTVLDTDGALLRAEPLPPSGHRIFSLRLVACDGEAERPLLRAPSVSPADPDDADGSRVQSILRFAGEAAVDTVVRVPVLTPRGSMAGPFEARTHFAYGPDRIHALDADRLELRSYDLDGRLVQVARLPHSPRPVTPEEREEAVDSMVAGMAPGIRDLARQQLQEGAGADQMPAAAGVLADDAGRVWIQRFRPAWEPADSAWLVLDSDGTLAGTVQLPGGFEPHDIGADWILGVARDDMDVPYVRLYRLEAGSEGG